MSHYNQIPNNCKNIYDLLDYLKGKIDPWDKKNEIFGFRTLPKPLTDYIRDPEETPVDMFNIINNASNKYDEYCVLEGKLNADRLGREKY